MNNFVDYFYDIKTDMIVNNDRDFYSFIYNGYEYRLYIVDKNININTLFDIDRQLVGKTLVGKIIVNKNGNIISTYGNIQYVLIKVYASSNSMISLNEIVFLTNRLYTNIINTDWGELWSKKIDYLENLIGQFGRKYPILVNSFNYFVGMTENAISYYNTIDTNKIRFYYISHRILRADYERDDLYNPINIIFDYKTRDIAEYFKNAFFLNRENIISELDNYINNNILSVVDIKLLIARLLYPSFYFELYDDILIYNKDERIINNITKRIDDYEKFLAKIIGHLSNRYNIDEVNWLKQ